MVGKNITVIMLVLSNIFKHFDSKKAFSTRNLNRDQKSNILKLKTHIIRKGCTLFYLIDFIPIFSDEIKCDQTLCCYVFQKYENI